MYKMILRSKPRFVDGCQLSIAAFDYHRVSTYVRPMILIPRIPSYIPFLNQLGPLKLTGLQSIGCPDAKP